MSSLKKVKDTLNEPFPFYEKYHQFWHLLAGSSLFPAVFFYFFKPLRLIPSMEEAHLSSSYLLICFGLGVIIFTIININVLVAPLLLPHIFTVKNWKLRYELVWDSYIMLFIASAGYLYFTRIYTSASFSLYSFFSFIFYTILIGIIPISFILITKQNYILRKRQIEATKINKLVEFPQKNREANGTPVHLPSENKMEPDLILYPHQIRVITASSNYVEVLWRRDDKFIKTLLRIPLAKVEEILAPHGVFFRCHRSFIVNILHIKNIRGNAQGYKLSLSDHELLVPVSRKYIPDFKARLQDLTVVPAV